MIIDHVGIAVKSIEKSIEHWKSVFGYKQLTKIVHNTRQQVNVVFLTKDNSLPVKLIEPSDESSPIYRFAQRGGGLHHLCFRCENVKNKIIELKNIGLRVLANPQPGEAFENEDIAFLFAKDGLNIELIDTEKRAEKIDSF